MANIKDLIKSISASETEFSKKLDSLQTMEETQRLEQAQTDKAIQDNVDLIVEAIRVMERKVQAQLEDVKAIIPEKGDQGAAGRDGRPGQDGKPGANGAVGQRGRDGADGADGVSVADAKIDFDGALVITLSTGQEINVGEVVAPDLAERIKVISSMSTNGAIGIKDEGSSISTGVKNINFVGATVTATASGDDVTVNVSAGTGTVTSVAVSGGTTGLTTSGGPVTTSGTITLAGTLAVANGGTGVTTSTGTGNVVLSNSPTLVTPALGTPSALVGTNITGTATSFTASNVTTNANLTGSVTSVGNATTVVTNANLTGGVTSIGNATTVVTNANLTGDVTSIGNATTLTNAPVIAKVLTGYVSGAGTVAATDSILQAIQKLNGNNATNANLTGAVTSIGNATLLGSFTSANLAGALTDETGSGAAVFATSPTLVTPALGTPTALVGTNITGTANAFNINGTVGATTPTTGAFTSLTASTTLTVTGAGSIQGLTVGRGAGAVASNTAVGANALNTNVLGSFNTALGSGALQLNNSGVNNTAIGATSLFTNVTGNNNTILGQDASTFSTTSNNTVVGYNAGYFITSGAKNTILGCYNGNQGSLDIRTLSNHIVLSDGDGNPRGVFNASGVFSAPAGMINTPVGATTPSTGAFTTLSATTAIGTASGGTGLGGATPFTANGVVFASSASALSTGSALTFDGTTLGAGLLVSAAAQNTDGQIRISNSTTRASGNKYGIRFADSSFETNASIYIDQSSSGNNAAGIVFGVNAGTGGIQLTSAPETMRLTATGLKASIAGTNAAPVFSYTGDVDTGIFFPAGNTLGFTAGGGTDQMVLTSTGLGIGTSSPGAKLEVNGSARLKVASGNVGFNWQSNLTDYSIYLNAADNSLRLYSSVGVAGDKLVFSADGNLGLGVTPSAFGSTFKAIQAGVYAAFVGDNNNGRVEILNNAYASANNVFNYTDTNSAGRYSMQLGAHKFFTAPSGTAGDAISFTQAMTLDASGNLGVGLTSASTRIHVRAATDAANVLQIQDASQAQTLNLGVNNINGGPYVFVSTNHALRFGTNDTERVRISSDGTFRVKGNGSAGTTDAFQVAGGAPADAVSINSTGDIRLQGSAPGKILFFSTGNGVSQNATLEVQNDGATTNTGEFRFSTRNTAGTLAERARIDSSGNLLVGTTSVVDPGAGTTVSGLTVFSVGAIALSRNSGASFILQRRLSDGTLAQFYRDTTEVGSISVTTTTTTYNTTSDYRLKTVIGPVANAGQRIDALQPVEYTWNASGERTRGFLAHQFAEVYAGSVSGTKDAVDAEGKPVYQAMQASTSEVIADLVAEIKSLRQRLAAAGI